MSIDDNCRSFVIVPKPHEWSFLRERRFQGGDDRF